MGTRSCRPFEQILSLMLLKTKKFPKWQKRYPSSWLPLPPPLRKSGGKTINIALITKAPAMSQPIFKPKKYLDCHPRASFCNGPKTRSAWLSQSGTFNSGDVVKAIRQPSYSPNTEQADIFQFQRHEVGAGWPLIVQGQAQEEPGGGGVSKPSAKTSPPPYSDGRTAVKSTSESALTEP